MEGTNFGLNPDFKYYEIYLDSLDTRNPADASYTALDWPLFQLARPIKNVAAIKVLEVQIPFSFYIFNPFNNTFRLTESAGVTNALVTIPVGNYNATTLGIALAQALNSVSSYTYTVTFSGQTSVPNTGKYTFSNSALGTTTFTFTFGNASDLGTDNPRLFLGFPAGSTTSTTAQVLVAPNAAAVSGPNYLYLNSQRFGASLTNLLPKGAVNLGSGTYGPQIAKIPINVQPGGVIYWTDPDPLKWFAMDNLNQFANFDLYITLGNNDTPDVTTLNGQPFSVKLGILQNQQSQDFINGQVGSYPSSVSTGPRKRFAQ